MGGCEDSNVGEPLPQSLVKRAGNKWLRARHTITSKVYKAPKLTGNLNFDQLNLLSDSVSWKSLKQDLSEVDLAQQMNNCDPVAQFNTFMKICLDKAQKHVPLRK